MAPPDPQPAEALTHTLASGHAALSGGNWAAAAASFEAALREQESPEALEALGRAVWWLDDAERVLLVRERAYRLYRERQDARGAARVAIALAGDYLGFRGEPAVARGWQQRARQLLEGLGSVPEQGWLRITEGDYELSIEGDPGSAEQSARAALAVAQELDVEDLRTLAHALGGASRVARGELREGLSQLDAAVTTALSGDIQDPIAIGYSCCYMLHACERARDFDRGGQWCARVTAFSQRARFSVLLAVCRAHHGSVLIGRGQWQEAEAELTASAHQLALSRPGVLGEALLRLAGLRRRQGRFEEASDLLQQLAGDPRALVEQARLALDRGDARTAVSLAERVLRRIPVANETDRASVLELMAEARLALAEQEPSARDAAAQALLELRAALREPAGVQAAALASCSGLLAHIDGQHEAARRAFEDAVDGFERSRAPFEAARARVELARELGRAGLTELASAELGAAQRRFELLGARQELDRAARRARDAGPSMAPVEPTAGTEPPRGASAAGQAGALSVREREVLELVAQGLSNRGIADRLGVSEFTIKRHVQNILTKLDVPTRAAAASFAVRSGLS